MPPELPRHANAEPQSHPHRDFVPIDTMREPQPDSTTTTEADPAADPHLPAVTAEPDLDWTDRTSLFGDASG